MHVVSSQQITNPALTTAIIIRYGAKLITVGVDQKDAETPGNFRLEQNYPNPFNGKTVMSYELGVKSGVRLVVYDLLGREVATLVKEEKQPGTYDVIFDASDLSSGVYFYRLTAISGRGMLTEAKTLVLLR
jgi:hypothetical protein